MNKTGLKLKQKSLQVVKNKEITKTPIINKLTVFNRDIKYLKVKDIKRAYSKLIQDWCKGFILNDDAKTIAYLLTGYIQSVKQYDFEERLNQIEKRINNYE